MFTLEEVHTLRDALNQNKALNISQGSLANAGWGDPQTLLLVGNDQRTHTTTTPVLPHSNEMLLVRLDPSKPWISMMSIPRELMVPIHAPFGLVSTRLNAALTYGGIPLLVKTIKQLGIKVQAQIMDNKVRVTGKKIDELQAVIAHLKEHGPEYPLQFVNFT